MLSDTTRFAGGDVRLVQVIQEGCFAVVNMTQDDNYGRTGGKHDKNF